MFSSVILIAAARIIDARASEAATKALYECASHAGLPLLSSKMTNEEIVQAMIHSCRAEQKRDDEEARKLGYLSTPTSKRSCCLKKWNDETIAQSHTLFHDSLLKLVSTHRP